MARGWRPSAPARRRTLPKPRREVHDAATAIAPETTDHTADPRPAPLRVGILADTVDHPGGIGRYVREVLAALRSARPTSSSSSPRPQRGVAARSTELAGAAARAPRSSRPATTRSGSRSGTGTAPGAAFAAAGADGRDRLQAPRPAHARCPTVLVVHDVLTITRARENSPRQARAAPRAVPALAHRRDPAGRGERGDPDAARRARRRAGPRSATSCPNGMSTNLTTVDRGRPAGTRRRSRLRARGRRPLAPQEPRRAHRAVARPARRARCSWWSDPTPAPTRHGAARRCSTLERAGRAVWIRGAGDPALRWCYEHARVVLFPTREEGFGLPLLEAMTFHAPVVASDELALREVAAGAPTVTHVDADDRDGWRRAIEAAAATDRTAEPPRAAARRDHLGRAHRAAARDRPRASRHGLTAAARPPAARPPVVSIGDDRPRHAGAPVPAPLARRPRRRRRRPRDRAASPATASWLLALAIGIPTACAVALRPQRGVILLRRDPPVRRDHQAVRARVRGPVEAGRDPRAAGAHVRLPRGRPRRRRAASCPSWIWAVAGLLVLGLRVGADRRPPDRARRAAHQLLQHPARARHLAVPVHPARPRPPRHRVRRRWRSSRRSSACGSRSSASRTSTVSATSTATRSGSRPASPCGRSRRSTCRSRSAST